jgi:porphobilinogen synthase
MFPQTRLRRGRRTEGLRRLAAEVRLAGDDLIQPLFVLPGTAREEPVAALPGVARQSVDRVAKRANNLRAGAVLIFGVPEQAQKDADGAAAWAEDGIVPSAVRALKVERPDVTVITDVCLCAYTSHGHCGVLGNTDEVDNDATLAYLGRMAAAHASAGADMVAPSAMMDGQVAALRDALDCAGCLETGIMSYSSKFASAFFGPFRDAVRSAPASGDRRAHQLPAANRREAVRESLTDLEEGADWLMVKPALPYLDVLHELRGTVDAPIAAYQVSGEYAMLKSAADNGMNEKDAALEALLCIKRAGANAIITYYAEEALRWLQE